jgi:hypothetical protein
MLLYLLVFAFGFLSATAASAIYQDEEFGRVSNGTLTMFWRSLMAGNIASLIWLLPYVTSIAKRLLRM